jgi:hypothetical protein
MGLDDTSGWNNRYIPHGAYEAAQQAWGLLGWAEAQLRQGQIEEGLEDLHDPELQSAISELRGPGESGGT